jgi:uncharacterized protein YehS (DUF1456 family)
MTNNDILRRLRYAFDFNNVRVAQVMAHIQKGVEPAQVGRWIQPEDFDPLSDAGLCQFLDGLIIEKRGPRPDGSTPEPMESISINEILKKLRIALSLREEGMMAVFEEADFVVTKAELGSFFRKKGQRNFAECPEHVLRMFIHGLGQETG